jgi:hypothetical protein
MPPMPPLLAPHFLDILQLTVSVNCSALSDAFGASFETDELDVNSDQCCSFNPAIMIKTMSLIDHAEVATGASNTPAIAINCVFAAVAFLVLVLVHSLCGKRHRQMRSAQKLAKAALMVFLCLLCSPAVLALTEPNAPLSTPHDIAVPPLHFYVSARNQPPACAYQYNHAHADHFTPQTHRPPVRQTLKHTPGPKRRHTR